MNACNCSWTPALPFVAFPRRPAAGGVRRINYRRNKRSSLSVPSPAHHVSGRNIWCRCAAVGTCGSPHGCWRGRSWSSARHQCASAARRHRGCAQAQREASPHGQHLSREAQPPASGSGDVAVSSSASMRHQRRPVNRAVGCVDGDTDHAAPTLQQQLIAVLAAFAVAASTLLSGVEPAVARPRLTADELNTIELFKESTPSVVYITNLASKCVI